MLRLILALALLAPAAFANRGTLPPGDPAVYTKDLSSTNLPATYGAAGNSYATSLTGRSNVCIVNGASTKVYGTTSTASNCTGGSDKFVVPASGNACFENVKVNSRLCLRSSSGTLSSGTIDVMVW
jgi:hypothetical protein